ncbi:hypothetical protein GE21DRAFT_1209202 [Neurospora crassa]|nr:hypothetical protein GE21DRAFT_1209202 [Neurospora crassa]
MLRFSFPGESALESIKMEEASGCNERDCLGCVEYTSADKRDVCTESVMPARRDCVGDGLYQTEFSAQKSEALKGVRVMRMDHGTENNFPGTRPMWRSRLILPLADLVMYIAIWGFTGHFS